MLGLLKASRGSIDAIADSAFVARVCEFGGELPRA